MSYQAIIAPISVRPHPDPTIERLAVGTVAGYQVIVNKNIEDQRLGVFFPTDGTLSHEMCYHNNLYKPGKGVNINPEGSGYFESNRRVRTQKFRGVPSEGIWLPLVSLAWTGIDLSTLVAGQTFTTLNDKLVCEKYYSTVTLRVMAANAKQGRRTTKSIPMFKEHYDTPQLRYNIESIPVGAHLIITEKLHGTSGRSIHGLTHTTTVQAPAWVRGWNWLADHSHGWLRPVNLTPYEVEIKTWEHVLGTRRVVKYADGNSVNDYYAGTDFRNTVHSRMVLHKGETVYYEITGYDDHGKPLMSNYDLGTKDDVYKELRASYGKGPMVFSYGQDPGTCGVWVYRITMTNEDGYSVEYSWPQVVARCKELGLNHVPVLDEFVLDPISAGEGNYIDREGLLKYCAEAARGSSVLDSKHIREGVCVRVESPQFNTTLKWKGFEFAHLEGIKKNEDYIDLEEVS
jgi:hypothetical protein